MDVQEVRLGMDEKRALGKGSRRKHVADHQKNKNKTLLPRKTLSNPEKNHEKVRKKREALNHARTTKKHHKYHQGNDRQARTAKSSTRKSGFVQEAGLRCQNAHRVLQL